LNIKPLGDRIVLKVVEAEEKTASGIVLPDTAKEKPQQGKVLAVGPGKYSDDGKLLPMSVKEGDTVLFAKYAGTEIKYKGEELLILRESDLLAIVE
jgi:chaperonin GroES